MSTDPRPQMIFWGYVQNFIHSIIICIYVLPPYRNSYFNRVCSYLVHELFSDVAQSVKLATKFENRKFVFDFRPIFRIDTLNKPLEVFDLHAMLNISKH